MERVGSKGRVLGAIAAGLLLALGTVPGATGAATGRIPESATYELAISGTTYDGNTAFPQRDTVYSPIQRFKRKGTLTVAPASDTSGVNFKNGVNPREIGLVSGNPGGRPEAGAVWYATNTHLFAALGIGNRLQRDARLDTAFVEIDSRAGTIEVRVDETAARASQLCMFNKSSGLVASAYQIILGSMEIRFSDGSRRVSGSFDFIGTGYIYPANSRVKATFTGVRRGK